MMARSPDSSARAKAWCASRLSAYLRAGQDRGLAGYEGIPKSKQHIIYI